MATIFDGYDKASDNEIIDQIALLETMTLTNVLKPYGSKMKKGTVKCINGLNSLFGRKTSIDEPEVKELPEVIEENKSALRNLSRYELDNRLRTILCERAKITIQSSEEDISVSIINQAADFLNINSILTPAQKADRIYEKFNERILINIQKEFKKQKPSEAKDIERKLDEKLKEMPLEQREKIQEVLNIDKLTGETLRNVLLKVGGPAMIMGAVGAGGFGAYIALSTVMHAIFTTMLGITLPFAAYTGASSFLAFMLGPVGILLLLGVGSFQMLSGSKKIDKEMLAQSVWLSVTSYGELFTPADDKLPSWIPQVKQNEVDRSDKEFKKLLEERDEAIRQKQLSDNKLERIQSQLDRVYKSIQYEKDKRVKAENSNRELRDKQSRIENERTLILEKKKQLESDIKLLSTDKYAIKDELEERLQIAIDELANKTSEIEQRVKEIKYNETIIHNASNEIDYKEKQISNIQDELIRKEEENRRLKEDLEKIKDNADRQELGRAKGLKKSWEIHFPKFQFQSEVLRRIANLPHYEDRLNVERILKELHDAKDPKSISTNRGKLHGNNTEHIRVTLRQNVEWRVEYGIDKHSIRPIHLLKFYKKGEHYAD